MLAVKIGLNEAIIIQQLHVWLQTSKHTHDGNKWVCYSYEDWKEQFPFWSVSTIRRIIGKLEQEKLILSGNHNPVKTIQTKWYRINERKLEQICEEFLEQQRDQLHDNRQFQYEQETNLLHESIHHDSHHKSHGFVEYINLHSPIPETTPKKKNDNDNNSVLESEGQKSLWQLVKKCILLAGRYLRQRLFRSA